MNFLFCINIYRSSGLNWNFVLGHTGNAQESHPAGWTESGTGKRDAPYQMDHLSGLNGNDLLSLAPIYTKLLFRHKDM